MNILQHKSWHVYSRDNIERVKRDEAKAKEENDAKERRRILAEQEARIAALRTKARAIPDEDRDGRAVVRSHNSRTDGLGRSGINEEALFAAAVGSSTDSPNLEAICERTRERQTEEKRVGLAPNYLVGQKGDDAEHPWYTRGTDPGAAEEVRRTSTSGDRSKRKDNARDGRSSTHRHASASLDPMHAVRAALDSGRAQARGSGVVSRAVAAGGAVLRAGGDDMSRMRAKRIERERAERERAARLLGVGPSPDAVVGEYSQQFNPHLARSRLRQAQKHAPY
eukprot:Opistho-2@13450